MVPVLLAGLAACGSAPQQPAPVPPVAADPPALTAPSGPAAQNGNPDSAVRQLGNGVNVVLLRHQRDDMAQLQVGLLAGSDFSAPGLAELAAEVLVSSGDATTSRRSVRQSVDGLGGTLTIEVNPLSTWITIRVPEQRWQEAQLALAEALAAPALSRSQIERVRDDYVLRRIQEVWTSASREVPRAFLLGNRGTSPYIAALLDRDPSEVSLFMSRLYRPDSAVVGLRAPDAEPQIFTVLEQGLGKWPVPTTPRAAVPVEARRLASGLYWAPSDPPQSCRAMVVLPLPDLLSPVAAELLILHACLTLDGIGGRLEGLQRERGLGAIRWDTELVDLADVPAIVLTTETTPTRAIELWGIVQAARQSLVDLPATPSEIQLAARRARLTAHLLTARAASLGRVDTVSASIRRPPDALERRFAALERPGAFNPEIVARGYVKLPAAMIVLGGQVPPNHQGHQAFELLPPGAFARLASNDPVEQATAATPWIDRAIEAVGGVETLRRFGGFAADVTLRGEGAPNATEQLQWSRSTGEITRARQVLGTSIETKINAEGAIEQSGDTTIDLPAAAVAMLRRELDRHPLSLLAACARGELRFRPVAQRAVGDRDLMILEAVDGTLDRLRIHVDAVSHLIRVVEVWETAGNGTVFHLREAWSDYRNSATMRAPFRRITELDDGKNRIEAVFSRWQPIVLNR